MTSQLWEVLFHDIVHGNRAVWSCAVHNLHNSTQHACQAKQEGSLENHSNIPFGLLIHLSKATDYETLSKFPFQSSEAAMLTAPKYIKNTSWICDILHCQLCPAASGSFFQVTYWLYVHAGWLWLCSVFWARHLLSHSFLSSQAPTVSNWKQ